jgi:hypothetical protein
MRPAEGLSPIQHSEFEIFTRADVRFGSIGDIANCYTRTVVPGRNVMTAFLTIARCRWAKPVIASGLLFVRWRCECDRGFRCEQQKR